MMIEICFVAARMLAPLSIGGKGQREHAQKGAQNTHCEGIWPSTSIRNESVVEPVVVERSGVANNVVRVDSGAAGGVELIGGVGRRKTDEFDWHGGSVGVEKGRSALQAGENRWRAIALSGSGLRYLRQQRRRQMACPGSGRRPWENRK